MSTQARPEGAADPAPEPNVPWCTHCGTDEYLIIESVEPAVGEDAAEFLEINYTCAECDRFYGHPVQHSPVWARRINVPGTAAEYLHCGEPMQPKDTGSVSIFEPLHTGPDAVAVPEVQLDTTLLRCRCGFQMSVPA
ncbi:hypothetical protein OL239_00085 [Arthrobacter sp. ATA002]|uniref:hypothetical protein n=1 Tax=Arthrobacter sp. ATA002 TaxID=2991715 RepID=UPI0022A7BD57|nr:hypothetical protein [Arthrobacter sp. ATA002]WAP51828.1 hypothetical protein OL239_00085 [Arthrobacter sp. ATA002]